MNRFIIPFDYREFESLIATMPFLPPRKIEKIVDTTIEQEKIERKSIESARIPNRKNFFVEFPLLRDDFDDNLPTPIPSRNKN